MRTVCLALLLGCTALAQPLENDAPDLDTLVGQLRSDALAERELAAWQLRDRDALSLKDLESVLLDGGLTPEQRERLATIARARFDREPRAAMGIQFAVGEDNGIMISDVIKGFDAARVLMPGDIVHSVDGMVLENREHLRAMILSRDPGDPMTLGITRRGKQMVVTLALGAFTALPQPARIDARTLDVAWLVRSSHFAPSAGTQVVGCGLSEEGWRQSSVLVDVAREAAMHDEQRKRRMEPGGIPRISIGGEPRGGVETGRSGHSSARAGSSQAIMQLQGNELQRLRALTPAQLQREIIEYEETIAMLRRRAADMERELASPTIEARRRTHLQRALVEERLGLRNLEANLILMRRLMRP